MTKVLLAEDNDMNRDMLRRRLARRGFDVVEAVDGKEAVETARKVMPDVILMDLSMPVMDGWEASAILKSDASTRSIPILALTAHAIPEKLEHALEQGCDDVLTKPFEFDELLGKIERLTEGS